MATAKIWMALLVGRVTVAAVLPIVIGMLL
jgi:hypothetical protein